MIIVTPRQLRVYEAPVKSRELTYSFAIVRTQYSYEMSYKPTSSIET